MNLNKICVYDFETDGINPNVCNPVQLGAVIIDARKLEFVEGAYFDSDMRPSNIDDENYVSEHRDTINWHASIQKCSVEQVVTRWKNAPDQEQVWRSFTQWLSKYNSNQSRKTKFSAPVRAGYNITDFDDIILKRLATKYGDIDTDGKPKIFHPRDRIDLLHIMFWWFENQQEPKSYTMDKMRPYFQVSMEKAHDALKDVYDEGAILIKCLKTQRWLTNKLIEQGKLGENIQV